MNKVQKSLAFLLLLSLILSFLCFPAFAAKETGLGAFQDTAEYESGVFSDVPAGSWFEGGVKTVYVKGIMNGVGDGRFAPGDLVTWAQAVTIAARLHETYRGAKIPETGGLWYQPYYEYASGAGILPYTCPDAGALAGTVITRQELAFLFAAVLDDADLPGLEGTSVPDLAKVDKTFRDAVQKMYAAGIITGKDGGVFDPEGQTTRAEIATIVTRLLCPGQRVVLDPRANQAMADQYGNYLMGGYVAVKGDTAYYLAREGIRIEGEHKSSYSIVARTDDGKLRNVMQTESRLERLSVDDDGMLYVIRDQTTLLRINPADGSVRELFTARQFLENYLIYDGEIYMYYCTARGGGYTIGRLTDDGKAKVVADLDWDSVLYLRDSFYCFNGKLYFIYGSSTTGYSLQAVNLKNGGWQKVIDGKGYDKLYLCDVAYYGATVWFYGSDSTQTTRVLKRASLLMPGYVETVAEFPQEAKKLYPALYANGPELYYQASQAARVWKVSSVGDFSELINTGSTGIEASAVTKQIVFAPALRSVNIFFEQIPAFLPDGTRTSYLHFLGKPVIYYGGGRMALLPGEEAAEVLEPESGRLGMKLLRAHRTARGDYEAEIVLLNGTEEPVNLFWLELSLTVGGTVVSREILLPSGENTRTGGSYDQLKAHAAQVFTVIFPAESLADAAPDAEPRLSATLHVPQSELLIELE